MPGGHTQTYRILSNFRLVFPSFFVTFFVNLLFTQLYKLNVNVKPKPPLRNMALQYNTVSVQ